MNTKKIATEILAAFGDPLDQEKRTESVTIISTFSADIVDQETRDLQSTFKRIPGFTGFQPFASMVQVITTIDYDPTQTTPIKIEAVLKNAIKRLEGRDLKIHNNNVKFEIKK